MDVTTARRRTTRVLGPVAGLTLAAGLLSGCGSGDDPAGDTSTTVGVGSTSAATPGTTGTATSHADMTASGGTSGATTSQGEAVGDDPEAADEVVIVISDFEYEMPDSVPAGATITIRNEDGVGHTVTSDDGVFDVPVAPGEEATLTAPDEPGDYPFHCTPHPAMTDTLTVEG